MKRAANYIGQLRIYSLADLVLLLVAFGASARDLAGAIALHVAFIAYLESRHSHGYRAPVPRWISYVLAAFGLALFWKPEGFLYCAFSWLYTKKTKDTGFASPLFRGLQNLAIAAGVIGYQPRAFLVGGIFLARNLLGDFRDTEKDRTEGVRTVPVILGVKRSYPNIHLLAILGTSAVWWCFAANLSVWWLVAVLAIEVATYRLTPR